MQRVHLVVGNVPGTVVAAVLCEELVPGNDRQPRTCTCAQNTGPRGEPREHVNEEGHHHGERLLNVDADVREPAMRRSGLRRGGRHGVKGPAQARGGFAVPLGKGVLAEHRGQQLHGLGRGHGDAHVNARGRPDAPNAALIARTFRQGHAAAVLLEEAAHEHLQVRVPVAVGRQHEVPERLEVAHRAVAVAGRHVAEEQPREPHVHGVVPRIKAVVVVQARRGRH
mmetsp:Transcript_14045/g.47431  ORF Transcript_14045/g.47431 Transcript_14045/m.47431 type:complete len:225 (-) Transcript_14045:359-1033(-)